jgi:SAM-dependent methyltransferase
MIKINLGCGHKHRLEPWINCDFHPMTPADKWFDMGLQSWPFDDASADEISAHHCLEHMENADALCWVMQEAYRVLIPGGTFEIEVPHPRSDFFLADPTHRMPITQSTLDLFNKEWCEECKANGRANTPLALRIGVDFKVVVNEVHLNERWLKTLLNADQATIQRCIATYSNVVDGMRFVLEMV